MSKLYPARRIAQGWFVLGSFAVIAALGMLFAHFVFGLVIYDKSIGLPATSTDIALLALFIGGIGTMFAAAGGLLLRARRRFYDR